MRIAMVGRYFNRQGGVSRVIAELADRVAQQHDVTVITHEALDVAPSAKTTIVTVPMRRRPTWRQTPTFARHADRVIATAGFDIVHAHDGQSRRPTIITAHSCYGAWLAGARQDAGLRGLASRVYPRHVATDRWERATFRAPDPAIVAISRVVADELETIHTVNPDRIRVIHNGVDTEAFSPAHSLSAARRALPEAERAADNETVLLFVGQYFRRKGLDTLLHALAGLRERPWRLQVIGGDDAEPFRALAGELGLGARVDFLGHQSRVAPYMQAADAFVFPTTYEPFGLVITEALACGTPVITSRHAGGAELMTDGHSGSLLDDPRNPRELRTAVAHFLDLDDAQRATMRAAARACAETANWDRQAARHIDLYEQTAANLAAGRPAWAMS